MAKLIMYVVVSFLTFKLQMKMYKATQFAIKPSTNTMLNIHPYRMYLNSSSTGQCVVLLCTIFNGSPGTSGRLYWSFDELYIYRSPIVGCAHVWPVWSFPSQSCRVVRSSRNDTNPALGITLECKALYNPLANFQPVTSPQFAFMTSLKFFVPEICVTFTASHLLFQLVEGQACCSIEEQCRINC